jgi:hypothetical protein
MASAASATKAVAAATVLSNVNFLETGFRDMVSSGETAMLRMLNPGRVILRSGEE